MRYILDANVVIALLNDATSSVARRARRERPGEMGISSLVWHELYFGAFNSSKISDNLDTIEALKFAVIEFDKEDARKSGEIRAFLKRRGTPIGAYDVLIAGQALARNLILVTNNKREFTRVPSLRVEDWQSRLQ